MKPIIEYLIEIAQSDVELLQQNDALGDDFSILREVDFLLKSQDKEKAVAVCDFINDLHYGKAFVQNRGDDYAVSIMIDMPIYQPIILSISALMVCISRVFGVEYDGWGSVIQKRER